MLVYDNGGRSIDRYTILVEECRVTYSSYHGSTIPPGEKVYHWNENSYWGFTMSDKPNHPQGVSLYVEGITPGDHLGKRIPLYSLPKDVVDHLLKRMEFEE